VRVVLTGPAVNAAPPTPLHAADGAVLVDACEAILKGALESQVAVGAVAAPASARLAGFARIANSEPSQKLLARHQTELIVGGDGARAVALAVAAMRAGRSGVAVVPAEDLVGAVDALREARAQFRDPEHGLAVILEDDPAGEPMLCPRRLAIDAGLAVVEPPDLSSLRDCIESALRLSRAGTAPVAVIVHASLLASIETIFARPNRIVSSVDELILQRRARTGARGADTGDLLRVARRLELNVTTSLPSPGEREVIGFIAVGACERALAHVLEELGLAARVPVLRLGLVSPVDEAPLQRFLDRVQHVVVLEPRPGSVMPGVLAAVEALRRRGMRLPTLSCREVPPTADGTTPTLGPNDGCSPSVLVRRIIHLLHAVRPSLSVATRLEAGLDELERLTLPARDATLGLGAAMRDALQMLREIDQEIRARPEPADGEDAVRRLAIESLPPRGDATGVAAVELFTRRRFVREGLEAVRQAARDATRRIILVVDVGGEAGESDLVRLADAAIPAGASGRVRVWRVDVNDAASVRAKILAELGDGAAMVSVIVLADGPPARLDADAIERSFLERDRLGYQPQQRLVWPADIACELRQPAFAGLLDRAEEQGATPIQGRFAREDLGTRIEGVQFRATAISEQVEVVRTKPPISAFSRGSVGLTQPRAVHAEQGTYRAHVAGDRGGTPGVIARILADAGRTMGYRVEVRASDEPCGRGRRAWAQVLFVRMRGVEARAPRTGAIPYGEADLVLGIDAVETLRALGPDPELRVASSARTAIVANEGPLEDQFQEEALAACGRLRDAAARCTQPAHAAIDDFAALCRTNLLSERLVDVALLGLAFQRGLVPVSLDAMESAVRRAESGGVGRSVEAFNFGRRMAAGVVVRRSVEERESTERLVRRLALELVRERFGGRRRAARFALSASGMLAAFARFGDGEDADRAARAVVTALHRSIVWGGTRMMRVYEGLIAALLRADPSGNLALVGAEPLAEALLVRDVLYVLSMSTSLEQRRRIRERLGVRASHGDTLERRFLSRFELLAGSRRFRLDFRSSDWPAEVVRVVRPFIPWSLRGEQRAQDIRAYAISLAERAARGFESDPAHWAMCMRRFAMLAADGGLRSLTAAELRASVEGL
jgi:indolepyruvate ferredoxin oxidoreductase